MNTSSTGQSIDGDQQIAAPDDRYERPETKGMAPPTPKNEPKSMLRTLLLALGLLLVGMPRESAALDPIAFWENRCAECHGPAGPFARTHLHMEDGKLAGRHNRDLQRFLALHETGAAQSEATYAMLLAQINTAPAYEQKCAGCHESASEFAKASLERRDGLVFGRKRAQPLSEILKRHGKLTPDEIPVVVDTLTRALDGSGAGQLR